MLAVVQFPIADFRPFLPSGGGRLPTPWWPPRTEIPNQFMRWFGPAVRRRSGVDSAWTDERAFCRANRALRFEHLPAAGESWTRLVRCAFRRLLSDGEAVTRIEVGLACSDARDDAFRWKHWDRTLDSGSDPTAGALDVDPLKLIEHVCSLRAAVPSPGGAAKQSGQFTPLVGQGGRLARLFLYASSKKGALSNAQSWHQLTGRGTPLALVECRAHWIQKLPREFVRVEPAKVGGVNLAFGRVSTQWGALCVWFLGYAKAPSINIRHLRLCLIRMHAEQSVLSNVLDRIGTQDLPYNPGSPEGNRLEAYLNKATRIIERESVAMLDQSAIWHAFAAVEATEYREVRADLSDRLKGIRRQIRVKLEKLEAIGFPRAEQHLHLHGTLTYVNRVDQMHTKTINIGSGSTINAPVTIADHLERSFNTLQQAHDNRELTELMRQLLQQIAQAAEAAPDEVGAMASDAEVLSKEIASGNPRRKWYELSLQGIKDAAEALGEVGKPILETAGKLLPLLAALFPLGKP